MRAHALVFVSVLVVSLAACSSDSNTNDVPFPGTDTGGDATTGDAQLDGSGDDATTGADTSSDAATGEDTATGEDATMDDVTDDTSSMDDVAQGDTVEADTTTDTTEDITADAGDTTVDTGADDVSADIADDVAPDATTEPDTGLVGEGGRCGTFPGGFCDDGLYCSRPEGTCRLLGGTGICAVIPEVCSREFNPVCGCDGTTFANPCEAARAQATIDYTGECSTTRGCFSNDDCLGAGYCAFNPGTCGGEGACAEIPFICPGIFDPVCGCDGMTYPSDCSAASAGVSIQSNGECP
jgi:hypothetical protein